MNQRIVQLSAGLLALGLLGQGYAQSEPKPITTCGNYNIVTQEKETDGLRETRIILKGKTGTVATFNDAMGNVAWCKDITGDKIPEINISMFTGGAHCCFTQYVYSLTTPPRKILVADTAHSDMLEPKQLDGQGPLELISADWRFAYAFGMSFAESIALPEVYSFVNGQYLVNTRAFPKVLDDWFAVPEDIDYDPTGSSSVMSDVVTLILQGKENRIGSYLQAVDPVSREWINSYLPDIKDLLSTYGYMDYPKMAGIRPEDATYSLVAGPFTATGGKQVMSIVYGSPKNAYIKDGQMGLVLIDKTSKGFKVTPLGLTFPKPPKGSQEQGVYLSTSIKRKNGLYDVVVSDSRSGTTKMTAYRTVNNKLVALQDDPLLPALQMLQDLYNLAAINKKVLEKDVKRTPEQTANLMDRAKRIREQGRIWADWFDAPPEAMGAFYWNSIEVIKDTPQEAQVYVTIDFAYTPQSPDDYPIAKRHGMTLTLKKGNTWKVDSVGLVALMESPYDETE